MKDITLKARLILYHRGKILLLRQRKAQGGNYTLPGGTVEDSEFARQCLIRECKEEAGISLKPENLKLAHVLHKRTRNGGQRVTFYFKANTWKGEPTSREPAKFKDVEWFDLDKLPTRLTGTVRHVLKHYRKGILYSEFQK